MVAPLLVDKVVHAKLLPLAPLLLRLRLRTRLRRRGAALPVPRPRQPAAAPDGGVQDEGGEGQGGGDPRGGQHEGADVGGDVELGLHGEGVLGDEAEDGGEDGAADDADCGEEGGGDAEEGPAAGAEDEEGGGDHEEAEDDAGDEEAEHGLRADAEELEDGEHLAGERDLGAGEELVHEDLDWVEPVGPLGRGAVDDAPGLVSTIRSLSRGRRGRVDRWVHLLIVVALAEVPEADLVEVVEAQAPRHRVEEAGIGRLDGDDVRELVRLSERGRPSSQGAWGHTLTLKKKRSRMPGLSLVFPMMTRMRKMTDMK